MQTHPCLGLQITSHQIRFSDVRDLEHWKQIHSDKFSWR